MYGSYALFYALEHKEVHATTHFYDILKSLWMSQTNTKL